MQKTSHKNEWKESYRNKRIKKKIEKESQQVSELRAYKYEVNSQISLEKKGIKDLWVQTLPWFMFLPLITAIIGFFDLNSKITISFSCICIISCFYVYVILIKRVKKSILFNRYLTRKALKHFYYLASLGMVLPAVVFFFIYNSNYWVTFALSLLNMFLFLFLAYYFGLVFKAYEINFENSL